MLQMTNAQAQAKTSLYCEGSCRHCLEILILSEALLSTSALPEVSATKSSSLLLPVSCVPLALVTKLTPFSIGRHIAFVLQMTSIQHLVKKKECQLWKASSVIGRYLRTAPLLRLLCGARKSDRKATSVLKSHAKLFLITGTRLHRRVASPKVVDVAYVSF